MPEPATDDRGQLPGPGAPRTPRLWLVRGAKRETDVAAAAREQPAGPSGNGNGERDLEAEVARRLPSSQVQAIFAAAERGAAQITELSKELAERSAEVARCRAEVAVAQRTEELLQLRREIYEQPIQIESRVERLRAGVRGLAARMQRGD